MTDNEIIKALECCKNDDCDNCPNTFGNCYSNLAGAALDIIERQKEEIERLTVEKDKYKYHMALAQGLLLTNNKAVRTKAIKEFADKLKDKKFYYNCFGGDGYALEVEDIDNLVKEMIGEEK